MAPRKWLQVTPIEVVLAAVTSGWAFLLWTHPPETSNSPVLGRVADSVGGISSFLWYLTAISVLQWVAVFVAGWPPKARSIVIFFVALWWTFITLTTLLIRWYTPLWPTTAGLVALAVMAWLRLRNELIRAEFLREEAAKTRAV